MIKSNGFFKNACQGFYGKTLDVKITNLCNANCQYCIEKDGYSPKQTNLTNLIKKTIKQTNYPNVLILGGEPLLFENLCDYIRGIRSHKREIFLTTNGFLLNTTLARELSLSGLTGINISIQHFDPNENQKIFRTSSLYDIQQIKSAIDMFKSYEIPVRINTLLMSGGIQSKTDIEQMVDFAKNIGADSIRFSELQTIKDTNHIYLEKINNNIFQREADPYVSGCEKKMFISGFPVVFKTMCNQLRNGQKIHIKKNNYRVLYPNGFTSNGWVGKSLIRSGCHGGGGCHGSGFRGFFSNFINQLKKYYLDLISTITCKLGENRG